MIRENLKKVTDTPVPYSVEQSYQLTRDLANNCIDWMRRQKAIVPDRSLLASFSPGAAHAPHIRLP